MRTFTLGLTAAVALTLASCMQQQTDVTSLKKAIDDYTAASTSAMMSGDPNKSISFYDDSAVVLAPNFEVVRGRDAIMKWNSSMAQTGMKFVDVSFTTTDYYASGNVGYNYGEYAMTMSAPSMPEMKDKGKYVDIWRQQQDGSWKIRVETWNTSMPMPSTDQPMEKKAEMKKGKKK